MTTWTREIIEVDEEKQLITGLILSSKFAGEILPKLKPRILFTEEAKAILGWLREYYRDNTKPPLQHIQDIFKSKKGKLNGDAADLIEGFLVHLSGRYVLSNEEGAEPENYNSDFAIEQSLAYIQKRRYALLGEDVTEAISQGNLKAAEEARNKFDESELEWLRQDLKPGHTLTELLALKLPPRVWAVKDLIPAGFTILGGLEKFGKSHVMRQLSIDVVSGELFLGHYPTMSGEPEVLYLDFEQAEDLAQDKFAQMMQTRGMMDAYPKWGHRLHIRTMGSWRAMGEGGFKMLHEFAKAHPNLVLVIIDVWIMFRPQRKDNNASFNYEMDYRDIQKIKKLADDNKFAVVALAHVNKALKTDESNPEEIFKGIYGGKGLLAAADNIFAFTPSPGSADGLLCGKSRVFSHRVKVALERNEEDGIWYWLGESAKYEMTTLQGEIYGLIEEKGPMRRKEIVEALGKDSNGVGEILFRMVKQGRLFNKEGEYRIPPNNTNSPNNIDSPNSPNTPNNPNKSIRSIRAISSNIEGASLKVDLASPEMRKKLMDRGKMSFRTMPD